MTSRVASIAMLSITLTWTVLAQTSPMREGNWEISVKMTMDGTELPPMKQLHCVTPEMVKDPQSAIPKGPQAGDCKVDDYKLADNTATFTMSCTQPAAMTMVGEMKYAGDTYTGKMTMDMSGSKMVMMYDAKRIGDCVK
jgi:hypothetical protein